VFFEGRRGLDGMSSLMKVARRPGGELSRGQERRLVTVESGRIANFLSEEAEPIGSDESFTGIGYVEVGQSEVVSFLFDNGNQGPVFYDAIIGTSTFISLAENTERSSSGIEGIGPNGQLLSGFEVNFDELGFVANTIELREGVAVSTVEYDRSGNVWLWQVINCGVSSQRYMWYGGGGIMSTYSSLGSEGYPGTLASVGFEESGELCSLSLYGDYCGVAERLGYEPKLWHIKDLDFLRNVKVGSSLSLGLGDAVDEVVDALVAKVSEVQELSVRSRSLAGDDGLIEMMNADLPELKRLGLTCHQVETLPRLVTEAILMKATRPNVRISVNGHNVVPAGGSYERHELSTSIVYDRASKSPLAVFDGPMEEPMAVEMAALFAASPNPKLIVQRATSNDTFVQSVAERRSGVPVLKAERGAELNQDQRSLVAELLDIHIL
jgi:hypothetical protein